MVRRNPPGRVFGKKADFKVPGEPARCTGLVIERMVGEGYFVGEPRSLRISSLIFRRSFSSLAIIHWSFSLWTVASKPRFSGVWLTVVVEVMAGIREPSLGFCI